MAKADGIDYCFYTKQLDDHGIKRFIILKQDEEVGCFKLQRDSPFFLWQGVKPGDIVCLYPVFHFIIVFQALYVSIEIILGKACLCGGSGGCWLYKQIFQSCWCLLGVSDVVSALLWQGLAVSSDSSAKKRGIFPFLLHFCYLKGLFFQTLPISKEDHAIFLEGSPLEAKTPGV